MDITTANVTEKLERKEQMEKIDNIYVIWHREEYKQSIEEKLKGFGAKITYIKGPNGKDPDFPEWLLKNNYRPMRNWKQGNDTRNFSNFHARNIKYGEVACAIGHLKAWRQAQKDNAQCALFLEQDAEPEHATSFKDIEQKINNYLIGMKNIDWDLLYLGLCGESPKTEKTDFFWLSKTIFSYCLHAYIVTPKGIDTLLSNNFEHDLCCPDEYVPALYASRDSEDIQPLLKHLNSRMKAYNVKEVRQNNGAKKVVGIREIPDGVSDTEDSDFIIERTANYPELIVIDDFIKDMSLLATIDFDKKFWEVGYSWWDGWWQSESTTNRHKLIEYIYRNHCPFSIDIEDGGAGHGSGFEHWIGIQTPETKNKEIWGQQWALNPHQDKDEDFWENHPQGRHKGDHPDSIRTPKLGTVFYTEAPERGGELQIWDEYDFHKVTPDTPYQIIKPKRNRLIIFDAGKIHAVRTVTKGTRKAVAINIWDPKPTTLMKEDY